ncbi:glycosyltransferase family 4 protein [Cohnella lupini]|uniref:Glycosyltransferase involved in cell wall biosynthesis n=1 Tax=Cohnella lupini TaxID=1294267 RepID=A0A3D9I4Q6_9BACL|nr:glycosyltransferase family 4 protein [Cohnella lupini]RED56773.1 glycosyltransferase involved in cell wall biosynthesis [Cohnella lupini]
MNNRLPQIAYVSTYIPKKCGLATYTHHLREAITHAKGNRSIDPVITLCNPEERADYREPWMLPLIKSDQDDYRKVADAINQSSVDIVSLQHEFGIFGGEAGSHIIDFLRRVKKPVVTTFHTVFEHPVAPYSDVQKEISRWSDHLLVMNRKGIGYLHDNFELPLEKITFIPHGTPVTNRADRIKVRREAGWENRKVLFTFGLLGRSKGIELILQAMASAVHAVPELLYVIAGQTHPEVRKHEGEAYREELMAMIKELGLEHHVQWVNSYVPEEQLVSLISACDLYVTPYPGMSQITSGTLAYAAGLGRPILSTPYVYAKDLVQGYDEMLLPFGDADAWSSKIIELFTYPGMLTEWERVISEIGRSMHWPHVGAQHLRLFQQIILEQRDKIADVG